MKIDKVKGILKRILPDRVIRIVTGLFYGWHGNYSTWAEARRKTSGYDSSVVIDKVMASAIKVRNGFAPFERDSVLYSDINYSFPVLSGLMWIAAQNENRLSVLDFGGSLGSSYFQNKLFLDNIKDVNWCIVEQPNFVKAGLQNFANNRLHFFTAIDDCLNGFSIHTFLLSSVLQYVEDPYGLLDTIMATEIEYLIIDRTPFIKGDDRITIQKVHPSIYSATYPCWFFNKSKLLSYLNPVYDLILEFDALDKANIPSEFKGFIFRKKTL